MQGCCTDNTRGARVDRRIRRSASPTSCRSSVCTPPIACSPLPCGNSRPHGTWFEEGCGRQHCIYDACACVMHVSPLAQSMTALGTGHSTSIPVPQHCAQSGADWRMLRDCSLWSRTWLPLCSMPWFHLRVSAARMLVTSFFAACAGGTRIRRHSLVQCTQFSE